MRALVSQGFYYDEHGEGRETRRYYRVEWGVPGIASVAVGELGGGKECVGRYYYIFTCSLLITTRRFLGPFFD